MAYAGETPGQTQSIAKLGPQPVDLHRSTYEELQIARIYTRNRAELSLAHGYNSEEDASDEDEPEGKVHTEKHFHDNGQLKFIRTYQYLPPKGNLCARYRLHLGTALLLFAGARRIGASPVAEPDPRLKGELLAVINARNETKWPKGEPTYVEARDVEDLFIAPPMGPSTGNRQKDRYIARQRTVVILEYLTRHHPNLIGLAERVKRRAAYGFGLWPTHQQWSEVYNEAFMDTAAPVHKDHGARHWPALAHAVLKLEDRCAEGALNHEYLNAPGNQRQEHPEGIHIQGMWSVLYVAEGRSCLTQQFPVTCGMLAKFRKDVCRDANDALRNVCMKHIIMTARFATLHEASKVTWHTSTSNQRLKVHCGVQNPDGVSMTIANQTVTWEERKCVVIDDSFEHKLESSQDQRPRTILEIKLAHPDLFRRVGVQLLDDETGLPAPLKHGIAEL